MAVLKERVSFKTPALLIFASLLLLMLLINPAESEYSKVYYTETGELIDISSPDKVDAYCTVLGLKEGFGNRFQHPVEFRVVALIDWENNPGKLTMAVEPLTDNIETLDDGTFQVPAEEYAAWRFEYLVENISGDETMSYILVFDSFGAELDIYDYETWYSSGVVPGNVDTWTQGVQEKHFFNWDGFILGPEESAQLDIYVELGKNSAGKQEYTSCTPCTEEGYDLNSEGTLKYKKDSDPGYSIRKGYSFKVKVPCEQHLNVSMSSTATNWYLRKPGDFYAQPLTSIVDSSHPVTVTFSGFSDLQLADNGATIPVFYALDSEQTHDWISASDLNQEELYLKTENGEVEWNMWQRLLLDMQWAGAYSNEGVITFSINNQ